MNSDSAVTRGEYEGGCTAVLITVSVSQAASACTPSLSGGPVRVRNSTRPRLGFLRLRGGQVQWQLL
jgi:hypothetical protein